MTRREVAQRLGKSVATVRRLEGVLLHPIRDRTGRRRFDLEEVERLASGIERGEVAVWQYMRDAAEPLKGMAMNDGEQRNECPGCAGRESRLQLLKDEIETRGDEHRRELAALREEQERERAQYRIEQRELERELRKLIASVDELA